MKYQEGPYPPLKCFISGFLHSNKRWIQGRQLRPNVVGSKGKTSGGVVQHGLGVIRDKARLGQNLNRRIRLKRVRPGHGGTGRRGRNTNQL